MIIEPAIDLKDGKVVRLKKGDFDTVHQVAEDPVTVAKIFARCGSQGDPYGRPGWRQERRPEQRRHRPPGGGDVRHEN